MGMVNLFCIQISMKVSKLSSCLFPAPFHEPNYVSLAKSRYNFFSGFPHLLKDPCGYKPVMWMWTYGAHTQYPKYTYLLVVATPGSFLHLTYYLITLNGKLREENLLNCILTRLSQFRFLGSRSPFYNSFHVFSFFLSLLHTTNFYFLET